MGLRVSQRQYSTVLQEETVPGINLQGEKAIEGLECVIPRGGMNVRPKFPKDRRLGGMEVVVLERENQALTAEVERLRDLLEKCPGEATGKDATVFEVRKMKSQIAQLSRQHCLMNNEIKVMC